MFRIFLTVWFVLAAIPLAHAGPVAAAIGALGTFLASGTALANLAISALLTGAKIGIGLLTKAKQTKQTAGVSADTKFGGDNPLSFVVGHFATPGQLEYANTWGEEGKTPNKYCTHVISLGDLPMGITGLWVDDRKVTLPDLVQPAEDAQGWPVAEFRTDGDNDHLWVRFYDGTQTETDALLLERLGGDADRPWQDDMIGRGVPLLIMTAQVDQELFNGIPQYMAETDGIALYDVRKDSSAGGSGTQRWNDPSTWAPSSNPIVQVYNILRGIHYDGTWIWGGRCGAWQLPVANWMTAMNAADLTITNADGSEEAQFRSGLEITVDQQPADVIEDILKGCSGRIAEIGGTYKITVGAPGAAVYSFSDETIVVTEGQSLDPFPGLGDTHNGAQASYPEPGEKWAAKDAPAYLRPDLEVLDDDRQLVTGLQFPSVPYALQVQRLLQTAVQDARRFRQHQITLPPEAWVLEPNDVVAWTSAHNGYVEKKFIVVEISGGSNFLQIVTLKEVDPADYSWDASTDEKAYSVGVVGAVVPPAQPMTGWQVFPATFSAGGKQMPSIEVAFSGKLDDVRAVHVQVRLDEDDSIVFDGELPYGSPASNADPKQVILNGIFLPQTDYEVSGRFVPFSTRKTLPSAWLPVTTPDVWINDIYPVDLGRLADDVREYQEWIGQGVRDLLDRLEQIATLTVDQDAGQYRDKQTLRREIASTYGTAKAQWTEDITAATGPDSAIVTDITTLQASVGGNSAAISAEQVARVDGDDALAAQITSLSASVDDDIATAVDTLTTQIETVDGKTGVNAAAITQLQSSLGDKADASAVQALATRVEGAEGDIVVNADAITSLQTSVAGKAEASAVSGLSTQIEDLGDDVAINTDAISSVEAKIDDTSASATFRASADYSPATGFTARIGLEARVNSGTGPGGTWQSAGIFFDVTSVKGRIALIADQVVVADGAGNVAALFETGTTYIETARIRNLNADNIDVNALTATEGFFDNITVDFADIENVNIESGMIAASAVTSDDDDTGNLSSLSSSYQTVASITVDSDSGKPVLLYYSMSASATSDAFATPTTTTVRVRRTSDSHVIATITATISTANQTKSSSGSQLLLDPVPTTGTYTYVIEAKVGGSFGTAGGSLIAQCNRK